MRRRQVDHSLGGGRVVFVLLGQPPVQVEPGECSLHYPPLGQRYKAQSRMPSFVFAPLHYLQQPPQVAPQPLCQVASVRLVSPHDYQPSLSWMAAECTFTFNSNPPVSVRILRFLPLIRLPASNPLWPMGPLFQWSSPSGCPLLHRLVQDYGRLVCVLLCARCH